MIKTNQLFEKLSPALGEEFLGFFNTHQKQAVNVAIQTMAVKRKMRPIFVQRMVPQKRYQWLQKELSRRDNVTIAENLVQTWFMETQNAMLCDFMDSLGITHNEKGEVEDMPKTVDEAKLKSGIDALLAKYDAEKVVLYLHVIPALDMAEWPALFKLLSTDERLRFPGQTEPLVTDEMISAVEAKAGSEPAKEAKEPAKPKAKAAAAPEPAAEEEAPKAKAPAKKAAPKATEEEAAPAKAPTKKASAKKAASEPEAEEAAAPKKSAAKKPAAEKEAAAAEPKAKKPAAAKTKATKASE